MLLQIPGLTVAADQTEVLARGYWPSYNVPFYPEIYRQAVHLAGLSRLFPWHAGQRNCVLSRALIDSSCAAPAAFLKLLRLL